MTFTRALLDYIRPNGSVPVKASPPHVTSYPFVLAEWIDERERDGERHTRGGWLADVFIQITVASLDPSERTELGDVIHGKLVEGEDEPPRPEIVWDEGRPGRELTRWVSDERSRTQASEAPGGATIYYREIDLNLCLQRGSWGRVMP